MFVGHQPVNVQVSLLPDCHACATDVASTCWSYSHRKRRMDLDEKRRKRRSRMRKMRKRRPLPTGARREVQASAGRKNHEEGEMRDVTMEGMNSLGGVFLTDGKKGRGFGEGWD